MTEETVFAQAAAVPDPAARAAFLDAACADNPALRRQIEELLAAHEGAGSFLGKPPPEVTAAHEPDADAPDTPRQVGSYKLRERIGEGGMGEVWVADQQEPIRRRVALKVIKPGMDSRTVLARFEAERQALALMDHPNIAKVLDAGSGPDGRPFFVMELVKGVPITEFCDARKLSPAARLELFVPVCRAIQHAHQKGIIHRDIKPSNVLVELHDDKPVPKVIDFGVAKAVGQQLTEKTVYTGFGALVGTPAYMAPEQASFNALDVDTRADVYALGVLLYELLAGSPPFEPERLRKAALDEVLRVVREEEPPRPSARLSTSQSKASIAAVRQTDPGKLARIVRGELDWIVMKALEKDRNRRYESAAAMARDVDRHLRGEMVKARPPSAAYRLQKFTRRNRGWLFGVAVVSVVLAGFLQLAARARAAALHERDAARAAEAQAEAERQRAGGNEREARAAMAFLGGVILHGQVDELFRGKPPGETTLRETLLAAEKQIAAAFRDQPAAEATVRYYVGTRLMVFGDAAAAVRNLERAVELRRSVLGPAHPDTRAAAVSLAGALGQTGDHDRAIRLLVEVRAGGKGGSPAAGESGVAEMLATLYQEAGRFPEAVSLRREMLAAHPRPDADRAAALRELGNALLAAGRPAEAEPVLRESLGLYEAHAPKDWIQFAVAGDLGAALLARAKYAEAEPLLLKSYDELKKREGKDITTGPLVGDDYLTEAAGRLAKLYDATNQPEKAKAWRAKAGPEPAPPPRKKP